MIDAVAQYLLQHDSFVLISHTSPDGDTLGSALALYGALLQLGKRAEVLCDSPTPPYLREIPHIEEVHGQMRMAGDYTAIAIDCGDEERIGKLYSVFQNARFRINIDHHMTNNSYADLNIVRSGSAATAEIIFELITGMGLTLDRDMGTCLYTGLCTDTGNFAYTNTTAHTFRVAAALMEAGIDIARLNLKLFRERSLARTQMIGISIRNLRMYCGGRLAVTAITAGDMESVGATDQDSEGTVTYIRDIDTVEIAAVMRETGPEEYKVSLRSKEYADIGVVAMALHGGGHKFSAGCTLHGSLEQCRQTLVDALSQQLKKETL